MNLKFLETFVWVARLKSFRLAADRLHMTQAAVSHRIAALERDLDTRLFERGVREVTLTHVGFDAREHAEHIVRLVAQFRRRLSNPESLLGNVRIGVNDTVAYTWLPALIDRISQTYPEVVLELSVGTTPGIVEDLANDRLDLALMNGPVDAPGLINHDLCTFACRWVASPNLNVPEGVLEIEDLARFPILSFPTASNRHGSMLSYFQRSGNEQVRLHTASLATLIRLAIDGVGLAAIPVVAIEREIAANSLRVLPVRREFAAFPIYAMYVEVEDRPLPPLIAHMADEVATAFCQAKDSSLAW